MATWYEIYRAAVLETDWSRMEERIQAAESAIKGRLHEFSLNHGGYARGKQSYRGRLEQPERFADGPRRVARVESGQLGKPQWRESI